MLEILVNIILVIYGLAILFVVIHSLFDAHLIYHYLHSFRKKQPIFYSQDFKPFVTIQLPVYNELYVVERLIDAVANLDYPKEKMEIQVLDDSTDETVDVIAKKIVRLKLEGINIYHIHRTNREGFKAGALKNGLSLAKGEFFAIFDADFLPAKNFLQKTIFYFYDSSVGMVQTKWGHINKQSSLLANLQAIALDGHFSIEQRGRNDAGYFINFNGTAGVWRKKTILDAGNWQADTLTEDFDLSYRAQMKGWKFKYLEDVITFGELPPAVSALKSQQFRWTKGGTETAKKHLSTLLSSNLPFPVKGHGVFHLIYSFGFISILACIILTVPIIFIKEYYPQYNIFFKLTSLLKISFLIYIIHYFISYFNNTAGNFFKKFFSFIIYFPLFVSLFIGLSLGNAYGILQGYFGIKSSFIRTPKFNSINRQHTKKFNKYLQTKLNWVIVTEGLLIFYFLFGLSLSLYLKKYGNVPLLLMAFIGFSMVFWWSLFEVKYKYISQQTA